MNLKKLEEIIGIKFEHKALLELAFIHKSYLNENKQIKESNEKLEFLGDSIISFVVADELYRNHPELSEGEYTEIRARLVSTETLGTTAKNLGLGQFLKLSKGEEKSGGRENISILADTYEALVGAIYLQSSISTAKKFIKKTLIKPFLSEIIKTKSYISPKTLLQEYFQKKYHKLPTYNIIKEEGPDHKKKYTVGVYFQNKKIAEGKGFSKKRAEEEAAKNALQKIERKEVEI